MSRKVNWSIVLNTLPFVGMVVFFLVFIIAATLYPGGTPNDPSVIGFDWKANYWCNLLNTHALNGEVNSARPLAIFGMVALCGSMIVFFHQFAFLLVAHPFWKRTIQIGGVGSMVFAALMFTPQHDLVTILSSLFGTLAALGIIREIYRSDWRHLKVTGLLGLLLLGLNNLIYHTGFLLVYLPLVQKITLVVVLGWIWVLNLRLRKAL